MADKHSPSFPVAIVRPSIIGAVAAAPLPGYVGNTAGSTGAALAIATGQHNIRGSTTHCLMACVIVLESGWVL